MRPQARVLLAVGAVVLAGVVAWVLMPRTETPPAVSSSGTTLPSLPEQLPATPTTTESAATLPADPFAIPLTPTTAPALGEATTEPAARAETTDPWDALNDGRIRGTGGNPFGGRVDRGATAPGSLSATPDTPANPSTPRTYTVQTGDSLYTISQRLLGSPKYVAAIQKANPKLDPRRLRVGQVLNIPDVSGSTTHGLSRTPATPADAAHTATPGLATGRTYKVQPGDTLHSIAVKQCGSSAMWEKIYSLNRAVIGSNPSNLRAGMTLRLPAETTTR